MKSLRRWINRLKNLAARRHDEDRLREEMEQHLAWQTEENIRAGMSIDEARRQAALKFGPREAIRQQYHAERTLPALEELLHDVRYAARMLRKSWTFTAIAAISLALAIGANTTIFSFMKRLLLDRLDVSHSEQLRLLHWHGDLHAAVNNLWGIGDDVRGQKGGTEFCYPAFEQLRHNNHVLGDLFAFKNVGRMNATINGTAQIAQGELVSGNFFDQLQVRPQQGRPIGQADDKAGAAPVALISADLWHRSFGSSSSVIGSRIKVNMVPVTIIGITPEGFTGAKSVESSADLFMPLATQPAVEPRGRNGSLIGSSSPEVWWLNIMGRVQSGISEQQAQAALDASLAAYVRSTLTPGTNMTIPRLNLLDGSQGLAIPQHMHGKAVEVLMAIVSMVLLLACCNIGSLLLARATTRQGEVSLRLALGAGRIRVLRGVLIESLLLAALGGGLGVLLAFAGSRVLPNLLANPWETSQVTMTLDGTVLAFTGSLTVISGLLFGIVPAWIVTQSEIGGVLKATSRTLSRHRGRLGKLIVGFQVMLSTVLAAVALLFIATLLNLTHINPGFRTDHMVLFAIQQPESRYLPPRDLELHHRIEERLRALPGVEAVTVSEVAYISDSMESANFLPEGQTLDPEKEQSAWNNAVGARFFHTMGIPILAGRDFNEKDTANAPKVGILSESLARKAFPGQSPIGRRFLAHWHTKEGKSGDLIQIVGVCGDTRYWSLKQEPGGMFYQPYMQTDNLDFGATYEVRTRIRPEAIAPSLRKVVQSIDPDLPIVDLRTQEEQIDASMQQERIFAVLTASFGLLALVLACVGIYGVMAYSVAQRTKEIGVRLALGALPRQVLARVVNEGICISAAGIVGGIAVALLLTRFIKSLLFGLQPNDPGVLIFSALLLALMGLVASWVPARRAATVQPMQALRQE